MAEGKGPCVVCLVLRMGGLTHHASMQVRASMPHLHACAQCLQGSKICSIIVCARNVVHRLLWLTHHISGQPCMLWRVIHAPPLVWQRCDGLRMPTYMPKASTISLLTKGCPYPSTIACMTMCMPNHCCIMLNVARVLCTPEQLQRWRVMQCTPR